MNVSVIRQELHNYLETANDRKIKAIYTMVEEEIKGQKEEYTDEFKAELDRRYAEYKNDGKVVSQKEMEKRIKKILSKSK